MAYPISQEALSLFTAPYRQIADICFYGLNEEFQITDKDIVQGGLSVNRYCVSGSKIEIGSVIAAEIEMKLNNTDGRFDTVQFEGAEMYVRVGTKKWDAEQSEKAEYHYIPFGYFTIDEAPRKLEIITLTALDRMVMFDKTVNMSLLTFPMTVSELCSRICAICNVTLGTDISKLPNHAYVIKEAPTSNNLTYRQILSWIAELTGTCGFIDWDGHLILKWYTDTDTVLTVKERFNSNLEENAIVITGVQVVTEEDRFLEGNDQYTFSIESNELIQHDHRSVAQALYAAIGGFTYTPFSATVKPMPHLYPLDIINFVDKNGSEHSTIITDYTFSLNTNTVLEGKGETVTKKGYASINPLTKREHLIIKTAQKKMNETLDDKTQSILDFNQLISNSLGLFTTSISDENGSISYYLHDSEKLEESRVIFTIVASGIAWTNSGWNDGEPVWEYGTTSAGNALFDTIAANRINADWIKTGSFVVKDSDGKELFYANMDTGIVRVNSEAVNIHIGARNYLRSSRLMVMEGYGFVSEGTSVYYTDSSGNRLTDNSGNYLIE